MRSDNDLSAGRSSKVELPFARGEPEWQGIRVSLPEGQMTTENAPGCATQIEVLVWRLRKPWKSFNSSIRSGLISVATESLLEFKA
jgi:hypothetical protein